MTLISRSQLFVAEPFETPVGSIKMAGTTRNSGGIGHGAMRRFDCYAVVFVGAGGGTFADDQGRQETVRAGDMLFIFPDVAHRYGPERGGQWDEFFISFWGPAFDLWKDVGIISPTRPIVPLSPIDQWLDRCLHVTDGDLSTARGQLGLICRLLGLIGDAISCGASTVDEARPDPRWLAEAKRLLGSQLDRDIDASAVAQAVGMSYETFRKCFAQATSAAPAQYRSQARISAGRQLLLDSNLSLRQIAETLGYSSEFHFSQRFKQMVGESPAHYRRSKARPADPHATDSRQAATAEFATDPSPQRRIHPLQEEC